MAAPKNCRVCGITKICDKFDKCVWSVYAAGIKEAGRTVRANSPVQQLQAKIRAIVNETIESQNGDVDAGELLTDLVADLRVLSAM